MVVGLALRTFVRTISERRFDFRGRSVLVTGGSRGLGLELARELIVDGARVAICARDAEELERARQDLAARGGRALAIQCDVTDRDAVNGMVAHVVAELGGLDVLVNNAGTIVVGPLEVLTHEDFEDAMRTNFWGPLHTILAVLPEMRRHRSGRIVNIASIGGKLAVPHLAPYSVSKFALVGLSEALRTELTGAGIVVTTVCPGLMRTGSPRNATFKGHHRAEYAWFSISDALPIASMDATRAARQILAACKRGDAEIVLSIPARLASVAHALFPRPIAGLLGLVNRLLPGPGGIGTRGARGADSESAISPSVLTALGDRAAARNNQLGPGERVRSVP
jgi:NAD(P)-dependent dehydrogenase (short-subunit alcohol dehydrogenase family)